MKFLSVGKDFRCGYKGAMGIKEISEYFETNNLELAICDDVFLDDKRISSSLIRDFIYTGDIVNAEKFLGRKYVLDCSNIKWNLTEENFLFTKKTNQVTPQNAKINVTLVTSSEKINTFVNFNQDGILIIDKNKILSESVFIEEIVM